MSNTWDWKQPPGHEGQPLLEWWLEQIAVLIVLRVGRRARKRGDLRTFGRMQAISRAGGDAETRGLRG